MIDIFCIINSFLVFGPILISRLIQSFKSRDFSFLNWDPYISIIDCVHFFDNLQFQDSYFILFSVHDDELCP